MKSLKKILRHIARNLLTFADLDLKVARSRLDSLGARHIEISAVISEDDAYGQADDYLLNLVPALIARARDIKLDLLEERGAPALVHQWPGEHYKFLVAIIKEIKPKNVLEIGTHTGLSALSMLPFLPEDAELITIDIIPWNQIHGTYLKHSDFTNDKFTQIICDLANPYIAEIHADILRKSDVIFIDAPKDNIFERNLLANFSNIGLKSGTLLIFDDIRLWNMLSIWREIDHPKLDITNFGHWTGTGLVAWKDITSS